MMATTRPALRFDDAHVTWRPFKGFENLSFWVLGVNDARQQVNLLFRFAPLARCPIHRHVGPTDTFVLEGEHRTFGRAGTEWVLEEVRPPGVFSATEGNHLHFEQGGAAGAIIQLSMKAVDGVIWEVLNDDISVASVATIDDFRRVLDRQVAVPVAG